jgi:transcriptional regulator with PAS, ATPase and Fis domain
MSKRDLKKYLTELTKEQLEEQVLDLYTRFKPVKTYYNFVFSPKEDKLLEDAKFKISKEYFPVNTRKPKARRSVAQKIIKHFIQLGVDSFIIADIMLYNIEVAQQFSQEKYIKQEAFYKSILTSFQDAVSFIDERGIQKDFTARLSKIVSETKDQDWVNQWGFEDSLNER